MEIVVIGAGLGGLAAALAAQRAGHRVTVLERAPRLRDHGAGVALPPNGVLALDALGLGEQVRAQAAVHEQGAGLHDRHGRALLATDRRALDARTGAGVLAVRRTWLHSTLAEALDPGTIRTGSPVTSVIDRGNGVVLRVGDESREADAAIVADGARSRLRGALFPKHPGLEGSGEFAARGIAEQVPAGLVLPVGELLDHRTGDRFGCYPLSDGSAYWYAAWDASADPPADHRHDWLQQRRAEWHPSAAALIGATAAADVHVVETARLTRPLPSLSRGRIALLGDAAHAMTPDLGQGACQALEDAVVLGEVLDGARPHRAVAALHEYDAIRRPRTSSLLRDSRRMNRVLRLTGPPGRLRDAVFRSVPKALSTRVLAAQFRFEPVGRPASEMP